MDALFILTRITSNPTMTQKISISQQFTKNGVNISPTRMSNLIIFWGFGLHEQRKVHYAKDREIIITIGCEP